MGVINVLDKHVAELIAAGEVVERPSSVIKELVENSIDAKAKNITVEIQHGGTTFMRVTDDGCGIERDDIKVAFLRHATSKVKEETDLNRISTLGFRGEALASISAVSRLQLITRNVNEDTGTNYVIEGGEEVSLDDAGCPVGTTFVIRDLFYNIPARAKFLKKDVAEGNAVSNIIDKTALSHPEIAFTYIRDGKQVLRTFGDGKLLSAIYSVFGREFAGTLIPVDYQLDAIKVSGYVTKPVNSRPNRNMQNFFINGRYVKSLTAMRALEEAFKHSIMVGKFPSCVLNIDLPYEIIDVNVHPSKIEVRFVNERPVFDAVYHAVKSALMQHDTKKQAVFKTPSTVRETSKFSPFKNAEIVFKHKEEQEKKKADEQPKADLFAELDLPAKPEKPLDIDNTRVADAESPFEIYSKQAVKTFKREESFKPDFTNKSEPVILNGKTKTEEHQKPEIKEEPKPLPVDENEQPVLFVPPENSLKFVGEAFDTYIIVERNGKELLLIDKHAAHERIIYEKLKAEKAGASSQLLLQPITVTLGKEEYTAAVSNLEMFRDCAFEVENFGNFTVIIRSVPQYIDASEAADCVTEMADFIAQGKTDIYTERMDWFYHNVACRSAVKGGNKNSEQELMEIVKTLEENPDIRYCPHGRPIFIQIKKSEIERQFGRA